MGARLTPKGLFSILRLSLAQLANRMVLLEDLSIPGSGGLPERIMAERTPVHRFEALAKTIVEWTGEASAWPCEIDHALHRLHRSGGRLPIGEIAGELAWNRQRLHRSFQEFVGLAPKATARLIRFKNAIDVIGYRRKVELADVAQACGYFDQAHFSRDFAAFTGLTPGQYLALRWPEGLQTNGGGGLF